MIELIQKKRFTESSTYLNNPHRGCCTFQHFNGDPLFPGISWNESGPVTFPKPAQQVIDGYLPCSVAYCRWFWELLEPQEGNYDFSVIEKSLEVCAQRGQTLTVRLMPFGSSGTPFGETKQPQLPEWYQKKYDIEKIDNMITLDHNSKSYLEKWGGCIKAFAKKFDKNPLLEAIDLAFIGPWGEGAGECSNQQIERFVKLYANAFKNTILISQFDSKTFKHARKYNAGWRVDCFGDLRLIGSTTCTRDASFNHMYDAYPKSICSQNAENHWQKAPVYMETCSVPMAWYYGGFQYDHVVDSFDIDFILEQGLKYHTTYFMPKYTKLPEKWIDKLSDFCQKIGYRYVYRQVVIDRQAIIGDSFNFTSWIENTGVAPIYIKYDFAVRMRQGKNEETVILKNIDIRKWMPGDVWIDENIKIPEKFQTGPLEISVALVNKNKIPKVRFAVEETFIDYWLLLGNIYLTNN